MKPKIAILRTDGINCDEELFFAFHQAGGEPKMVHINDFLKQKRELEDFQILALPGGFSYGDDILSAKILANELYYRLGDKLSKFIEKGKLIIGICNGFQVLIRMGFLPWQMKPAEDFSLIFNDSGKFECRWIRLRIKKTKCFFTKDLEEQILELPVAHGEGKFIAGNQTLIKKLEKENLIVFQYVDQKDKPTEKYPDNPNGSIKAIAGITDRTGRILGLMPHLERNILPHHHPNWTFSNKKIASCLPIFKNAVNYFKY